MNYTAIKVDDYWIITSDEEIKLGDYGLHRFAHKETVDNHIVLCTQSNRESIQEWWNKIIACSKEVNGLPVFVPEWEENLDAVVNEIDENPNFQSEDDIEDYSSWKIGVSDGYNKAKEKYQFTEEDIINAFRSGLNSAKELFLGKSAPTSEEYLQSITKSKQYQVEIGSVSDNRIEVKSWKGL